MKTTALGSDMYIRLGAGKYIKDQLPPMRRERIRTLLSRGAPALSVIATNIFSGEDWSSLTPAVGRQVRLRGFSNVEGIYCAVIELSTSSGAASDNADQSAPGSDVTRVFVGDSDKLPRRIEREVTRGAYTLKHVEKFSNYRINVTYPLSYFATTPTPGETATNPIRSPRTGSNVRESRMAPEFSLPGPGGRLITLNSLHGKYVLLQFWGTWCPVCDRDWGTIKKWKQLPVGQRLVPISIGLDSGRNVAPAKAKIKQSGVTWTSVGSGKGWADPLALSYEVNSLPYNVLIGPDGHVLAKEAPLDDMLQLLLPATSAPANKSASVSKVARLSCSSPVPSEASPQAQSTQTTRPVPTIRVGEAPTPPEPGARSFPWLSDSGLHVVSSGAVTSPLPNVGSYLFASADPTKSVVRHAFLLKNESSLPLIIRKVGGSCGCIAVTGISREPEGANAASASTPVTVAPQATISVTVELDLNKVGAGVARGKYGLVYVEGTQQPVVALEITGKVPSPVRFVPESIAFGVVPSGRGAATTVKVYCDDPALRARLASELTLESDNSFLIVRRSAPPADGSYVEYGVAISKEAPIGIANSSLRFAAKPGGESVTSGAMLGDLSLPVSAVVRGEIHLTPLAVVFPTPGTGDQVSGRSRTFKVTLESTKDGLLDNMRIASGSPWLFVNLTKQSDHLAVLTVTINENAPRGMLLRTELLLHSPKANRDIIIPVTGEVEGARQRK